MTYKSEVMLLLVDVLIIFDKPYFLVAFICFTMYVLIKV